jgi:hypothetical protein
LQEENLRLQKAEEDRKAAAAPDRDKLIAFATQLRALQVPVLSTTTGKSAAKTLAAQVNKFAEWIEAKADTLTEPDEPRLL